MKIRINDNKIMHAIESNLSNGKFVIFPFGLWGKRVKQLLNTKYGIEEIAIVDNKLAIESKDILTIHDIKNIKERNYVVLFAVSDSKVYSDLLMQLSFFPENSVCNIASLDNDNIYFSMCNNKMKIETCNREQLEIVFDRTKQTWSQLGNSQPYWSVLTDRKYSLENMDDQRKREFYGSGQKNCKEIIQTLIRNDVIKEEHEAKNIEITEIGCGTGRVTKHLARMFKNVFAIDVSTGNMKIAEKNVEDGNVSFRLFKEIKDYDDLPKTDVVYSIIVLQHNVPPVIEYILNAMLKSLKSGGCAFFQVPTYQEAYSFSFDKYLEDSDIGKMEMHPLPQKKIFEIIYENDCIPMEVYQDELCHEEYFSCTFVVKKRKM